MTAPPRWSLDEAMVTTESIALPHTIGAAVGVPAVVFEIDERDDPAAWAEVAERLAPLAVVTIAAAGPADVVGDVRNVDSLAAAVATRPHAATTAAQLLRHLPTDPIAAATAESFAYAMLQAGPEHTAWLAAQGRRTRNDAGNRLRVDPDPFTITLTRPRLHNLLDRWGRDELADAFRTAALATTADQPVHWRAEGPSFCAGGDLAEFGSVSDPATAHAIRSAASPAAAIHAIRDRLTVHVHGACVGAGVELAAFAHRVIAHPDTRFRLPEVTMGLIPGVGGTWSISQRIGTQRLLEWLLLDIDVDAETALDWGLVDDVSTSE